MTVGGHECLRTHAVYEYQGAEVAEAYYYVRKLDDDLFLEFDIGGNPEMTAEEFEGLFE